MKNRIAGHVPRLSFAASALCLAAGCQLVPRHETREAAAARFARLSHAADLAQQKWERNPENATRIPGLCSNLEYLRGRPVAEIAAVVDERVNLFIRQADDRREYWQAPFETMDRQAGDCEDYALLKKRILIYLGVPESDLAIALMNQDGAAKITHAALVCRVGEGAWIILDPDKQPRPVQEGEIILALIKGEEYLINKEKSGAAGQNGRYAFYGLEQLVRTALPQPSTR